jgi:hypothetical protein
MTDFWPASEALWVLSGGKESQRFTTFALSLSKSEPVAVVTDFDKRGPNGA